MNPARLGGILGSAAALMFSGCAVERYSAVTYDAGYHASEPTFVERRVVVIDNRRRLVPIYRTGDAYHYTWAGRRYALADDPSVTRTRIVHGSIDYDLDDAEWEYTDWDDRRRIRRSARRLDLENDVIFAGRRERGVEIDDNEFGRSDDDLRLRW